MNLNGGFVPKSPRSNRVKIKSITARAEDLARIIDETAPALVDLDTGTTLFSAWSRFMGAVARMDLRLDDLREAEAALRAPQCKPAFVPKKGTRPAQGVPVQLPKI